MVSYNAEFYHYLAFSKPVQLYPWWLYFSAWNPIHCQHIECHNAINKPAVKVMNTSVPFKVCPVSGHFSLIPVVPGIIRTLETEWKVIVYHSNYGIAKYNYGNPIVKFLYSGFSSYRINLSPFINEIPDESLFSIKSLWRWFLLRSPLFDPENSTYSSVVTVGL